MGLAILFHAHVERMDSIMIFKILKNKAIKLEQSRLFFLIDSPRKEIKYKVTNLLSRPLVSSKHWPLFPIQIMAKFTMDIFAKPIYISGRKFCGNLKKLIFKCKTSNSCIPTVIQILSVFNLLFPVHASVE